MQKAILNSFSENINREVYVYVDGGRSIEGIVLSVDETTVIIKMTNGHTILDLNKVVGVTIKSSGKIPAGAKCGGIKFPKVSFDDLNPKK